MTSRNDRETIFATLRREILDGSLEPGAALREVALAERFEVSRTPVRDALTRLEETGLLVRAKRGLEVRGVDPQTVLQVYDARIILEEQVAGDAALNRTVRDVLRLEALLERDRALEDPDDAAMASSDLDYHQAIRTASGNPVLQDLLDRLAQHPVHTPRSTLGVDGRWEEALDEHAEMLRAISDRDAGAARAIVRSHVETARALRMRILRASVKAETTGSDQRA